MLNFVFSPAWFYGIDTAFEVVTMAVAALISLYSYKIYKFSELKRYFYFSISFAMLSLSFLAKILTNITIYYNVIEQHSFGLADIAVSAVRNSNILFTLGFLSYRSLTLLAFLGIYLVMSTKVRTSRSAILLFVYFILATVFFSNRISIIFHITALSFLFFILMFTLRNCYNKPNVKSILVSSSFFMIMLSQLIFIPALYNDLAYVTAEVVQLVGYTGMLAAYMMIRKK